MDDNRKKALFGGIGPSLQESKEPVTPETPEVRSLPEASPARKVKTAKSKRKNETIDQVAKKKTSLYLPPEKYKALKVLCAEMEITVTTFIEDAVDAKMKSESRKRGKEAGSHDSIES